MSEDQYRMYFIRGVDNTRTEFNAKAVIDTSCCRLDILRDWAAWAIWEGEWHVKCTDDFVLQSLTVDELEDYDYYCDCRVYCIQLNLNDQTMK